MAGSSHDSTVRAILYAFLANLGIAIAKTPAAIVTGSGSMLAEAIDSIICEQDGIECVLNTITIQFGPDTVLTAKVRMEPKLNVDDAVANINALEQKLRARAPKLKWSFVEPDTAD